MARQPSAKKRNNGQEKKKESSDPSSPSILSLLEDKACFVRQLLHSFGCPTLFPTVTIPILPPPRLALSPSLFFFPAYLPIYRLSPDSLSLCPLVAVSRDRTSQWLPRPSVADRTDPLLITASRSPFPWLTLNAPDIDLPRRLFFLFLVFLRLVGGNNNNLSASAPPRRYPAGSVPSPLLFPLVAFPRRPKASHVHDTPVSLGSL